MVLSKIVDELNYGDLIASWWDEEERIWYIFNTVISWLSVSQINKIIKN